MSKQRWLAVFITCIALFWSSHGFSNELMKAIEDGENFKIHQLAKMGVDLNRAHSSYGGFRNMTPVVWAIKNDNVMGLSYLLRYGADPNSTGGYTNLPAIAQVAQTSKLNTKTMLLMIDVLMKYGANVRATSTDGGTVLHSAAYSNRPEVVAKYIEYGADINAKDNDGKSAYELAKMFKHKKALSALSRKNSPNGSHKGSYQTIDDYNNSAIQLRPYSGAIGK